MCVTEEIHLSPEDELALAPILEAMSWKARQTLTLPAMLSRWEHFISEVEAGYADSIYEYTNDLSVRDLLQTVVENSPLALGNALRTVLQPLDDRFRGATAESENAALSKRRARSAWWWFRIPVKPGYELKNDLSL